MNMRMMKRKVWGGLLMAAWLMATSAPLKAQTTPVATGNEGNVTLSSMVQPTRLTPRQYASRPTWETLKGEITLYMTNDMGRNGYYEQKPIAELMGEMAGTVDPECVLAVGDIHHFNGVASLQDPLWLTNFEWIYSHPDLMYGAQNEAYNVERGRKTPKAVYLQRVARVEAMRSAQNEMFT